MRTTFYADQLHACFLPRVTVTNVETLCVTGGGPVALQVNMGANAKLM